MTLNTALVTFGVNRGTTARRGAFNCGHFRVLITAIGNTALIVVTVVVFCRTVGHFGSPPRVTARNVLVITAVNVLIGVLIT